MQNLRQLLLQQTLQILIIPLILFDNYLALDYIVQKSAISESKELDREVDLFYRVKRITDKIYSNLSPRERLLRVYQETGTPHNPDNYLPFRDIPQNKIKEFIANHPIKNE